jgi:hypothetical protein
MQDVGVLAGDSPIDFTVFGEREIVAAGRAGGRVIDIGGAADIGTRFFEGEFGGASCTAKDDKTRGGLGERRCGCRLLEHFSFDPQPILLRLR